MGIIKKLFREIEYIFLNCIVAIIPLWILRKFFYQLFGMKIGKGARILMHCRVYHPHRIKIGERTFVNECCYLDGRGGIEIGSDVTIATYSKLITGSHSIDDDTFSYCEAPIKIGDNAALFSGCIVLGGAVVGSRCVFFSPLACLKGRI